MKIGRALPDPSDEFLQSWMGLKRLYRVEVSGKLRFREGRVDFVVTDLMQKNRRAALATPQSGDQMMQALPCIRRDRTAAKGAGREIFHVSCGAARYWLIGWCLGTARQGQDAG